MDDGRPAPRVLLLALSFGSGHLRAADALAAEIRRQAPGADVRVSDPLADGSRLFRALYGGLYWAMLRLAPALWRRLFESRLRSRHGQTAPRWLFRVGCRRTFALIRTFDPDVIVGAEVGACEIAVLARRLGWTRAGLVALVTDAQAEPAWVAPEVLRYAVPTEAVRTQLLQWGARAGAVAVTGIPIDGSFRSPQAGGQWPAALAGPRVLLMGGGAGPTRMDEIAAALLSGAQAVSVVAVAGNDRRARRALERLDPPEGTALTVLGWTDQVAALMQAADLVVTKPGGLTLAEAAVCGAPVVLVDPIPGPEERNAERVVREGAGVLVRGGTETVRAVFGVLADQTARARMRREMRRLAMPEAAETIARIVLSAPVRAARPVLLLSIANGAGHTRAAEAIGEAVAAVSPRRVEFADVADYLSPLARLTHVTVYLWLVRHAPALWARIDRAQKRRPHTSPEWYYRRAGRRLRATVGRLEPAALLATEVGCCEMAALMARDAGLRVPLAAVNGEYDADRAWVQPEVTAYFVPDERVAERFVANGAPSERVHAYGVPLAAAFEAERSAEIRARVAAEHGLDAARPIVLVGGGSEGLGDLIAVAERILGAPSAPQVLLLCGRNVRLRDAAAARLRGYGGRARILGWTPAMPALMRAADLLVSKLGHVFDEAVAVRLPIVALPCPPGAEQIQLALLEEWGIGRVASTAADAARAVDDLLRSPGALEACRRAAAARPERDAAGRIARWLVTSDADIDAMPREARA